MLFHIASALLWEYDINKKVFFFSSSFKTSCTCNFTLQAFSCRRREQQGIPTEAQTKCTPLTFSDTPNNLW